MAVEKEEAVVMEGANQMDLRGSKYCISITD